MDQISTAIGRLPCEAVVQVSPRQRDFRDTTSTSNDLSTAGLGASPGGNRTADRRRLRDSNRGSLRLETAGGAVGLYCDCSELMFARR